MKTYIGLSILGQAFGEQNLPVKRNGSLPHNRSCIDSSSTGIGAIHDESTPKYH